MRNREKAREALLELDLVPVLLGGRSHVKLVLIFDSCFGSFLSSFESFA